MHALRRPNLFMIGGPKCGTTSFQEYLAGHPQIFMSEPKEPCYFDKDIPFPSSPRNDAEYMRCFAGAGERHVVIGEASTNYLYSKVAVTNILAFNPVARFIVMLRNPIDMAASLHSEAVKTLTEDVCDFRAAWALQEQRRMGQCLPRFTYQKDFTLYGDFCRLGEQLQRLFRLVDREHVHVILFDDLKKHPRRVYLDTLHFVRLPDDGRTEFPVRNAFQQPRVGWMRDSAILLAAVRRRLPIRKGLGIMRGITRLTSKPGVRPPLSLDFHQELADYFRSDVALLGELLGRDFSDWVTVKFGGSAAA
jgi:Sulfotransferase domain